MLLELVKGLKNLSVLKKQLERIYKGLNIKISYSKHKQKDLKGLDNNMIYTKSPFYL
jgi:hypothetical protein